MSFYAFARGVVSLVSKLMYKVRYEGVEQVPEKGFVLCSNHISQFDPIFVAVKLKPQCFFMAKEELFRFKPLAWALRHLGAFPVSRGDNDIQAVKTAIQAIKGGDNLLIFPEGTVIRNGIGCKDGLPAHAKAGVAVIGVRTGATMIPVFVDGEKKPFHRTRIIFGKPYIPVYTGRHGTSEEMQKIADDILAEAYALGGQTVGGEPL